MNIDLVDVYAALSTLLVLVYALLRRIRHIPSLICPEESLKPASEARITRVEADILELAVALETVRNKVLRKIQNKPEAENLNTSELRGHGKRFLYGGQSKE